MGNVQPNNLTAVCDAARAPLHPTSFSIHDNCTVANGSCPAECTALIENVLDICPGEQYFLHEVGAIVPFSAGSEVTGQLFYISQVIGLNGSCTSTPLDVLIESGVYAPTCVDGLELLIGSSFLCSGVPNSTGCPEVCERMMDVAFDLCTEEDVLPSSNGLLSVELGIDEDMNATQVVALSLGLDIPVLDGMGLGSSGCAEALAARSFRASATPAGTTTGQRTMPGESTSAEAQTTTMGASGTTGNPKGTTTGHVPSTTGNLKGTTASGVGGQSTTTGSPDEIQASSTPGSSLPAVTLASVVALVWSH